MTTHSNYSLQNFSTNNAKVLTENSQPVLDFTYVLFQFPYRLRRRCCSKMFLLMLHSVCKKN